MDAHDLIKLGSLNESKFDIKLPNWAIKSLEEMPYVVVRRGNSKLILSREYIPVGIRGESREERLGCYMIKETSDVVTSPEEINIFGFSQLEEIFGKWSDVLKWGPVGSIGFEIVSGKKVTTSSSDLDILIKAKSKISREQARNLLEELKAQSCIFKLLDLTLRTPKGWVNFFEYANSQELVLLKTNTGEELVKDVW